MSELSPRVDEGVVSCGVVWWGRVGDGEEGKGLESETGKRPL